MTTTALAAAGAVAEALADPRTVAQSTDGRTRPQSLAGGAAGIALLHIERALSGHGEEATAHRWLQLAASEPLSTGGNANLFHGAPALGLALHAATAERYRRPLATIDDHVVALTRTRLAAAHARIDRGDRLPMREFDLIHGLTGLGVYHLRRHPDHPVTNDVLRYLVRLTEPLQTDDEHPDPSDGLPPWWLPAGLSGEPDPARYPHGHGNLGLAHGISAVIALLSLAELRNQSVHGSRDAITALCAWTDRWRQYSATGPWWPGYLTIDHVHHGGDEAQRPRPSWCYGVAGTARAQQLAGLALADPNRQSDAESAVLAALRDPAQRELLPDIGLCHGKAGLLQASWRIAADARNPGLADALADLTGQLTTQLTSATTVPELLDGTAGAALALHTAGTGSAPTSGWDAILLLA